MLSPEAIVQSMYDNDDFSQWLGIDIIEVDAGYCKIRMTLRQEMTNGFDIAHGGISFSLADSAFAFASNSRGRHAVSTNISITHAAAIKVGDVLTATATEDALTHRLGHYRVLVHNQEDKVVAIFKGTVYRKDTEWI